MLRVEALNHYYGGSHTLTDISFEVGAGSCTAVLGRNGVGKSTLLKALMGVESIRSGAITFDGHDITRAAPHVRARLGIGYVPQGREIFSRLSVEENLLTGLVGQKTTAVAEEIYEMFPGLKEMRRRRGGDLSGGQQQQLAIGRALLTKPKLLILDEPTEGIQPSIIKDIERVIQSLARRGDMAILLVEQYYEFARLLAHQYILMQRGAILRRGRGEDMDTDDVRGLLAL
jgi:urea transport system ATP-binding protein